MVPKVEELNIVRKKTILDHERGGKEVRVVSGTSQITEPIPESLHELLGDYNAGWLLLV